MNRQKKLKARSHKPAERAFNHSCFQLPKYDVPLRLIFYTRVCLALLTDGFVLRVDASPTTANCTKLR